MQWIDVAGPPGSGKSTICDPLWGPREPAIDVDVPLPEDWHDFLNEVARLLQLLRDHWSFVPAVRMNRRTCLKMATVAMMDGTITQSGMPNPPERQTYIQAGFVQRGLGFGWRLEQMELDPEKELRHYFRLMPVSLGVVFLDCKLETLQERNKAREEVKETAHENRTYQLEGIMRSMKLAKGWLDDRGTPWEDHHTDVMPIEQCRDDIVDFANHQASHYSDGPPPGSGGQISTVSRPIWL